MPLKNPQHQLFVDELFNLNMNGAKAAIAAGYSEKGARQQAHRLLTNVDIQGEIQVRLAEKHMGADEVLARLADHARMQIDDYIRVVKGQVTVNVQAMKRDGKSHLIKSIKPGKYGTIIEFHDVQRALELIGKYHALFTDRIKIDDWRSQAIDDIRAGKIDYKALADAFDEDLATELFRVAGVPVISE